MTKRKDPKDCKPAWQSYDSMVREYTSMVNRQKEKRKSMPVNFLDATDDQLADYSGISVGLAARRRMLIEKHLRGA